MYHYRFYLVDSASPDFVAANNFHDFSNTQGGALHHQCPCARRVRKVALYLIRDSRYAAVKHPNAFCLECAVFKVTTKSTGLGGCHES
jgi:hypothetical protein